MLTVTHLTMTIMFAWKMSHWINRLLKILHHNRRNLRVWVYTGQFAKIGIAHLLGKY